MVVVNAFLRSWLARKRGANSSSDRVRPTYGETYVRQRRQRNPRRSSRESPGTKVL